MNLENAGYLERVYIWLCGRCNWDSGSEFRTCVLSIACIITQSSGVDAKG